METLVVASNNKHKIEEIISLSNYSFHLKSLAEIGCNEDLPETQPTLEGNALQKAQYVFDNYHIPCFADDTGLEVEVLNGEPGVYSARYAGDHKNPNDNIDLLLQRLEGLKNRNAQFRVVIALVGNHPPHFFEGIVKGKIIEERRGKLGFGYDPVFLPDGHNKTFAEMTLEEKNLLSHRAIAVKKLITFLKEKYQ